MLVRRPCTPADLDALVAHYGIPEVYRYLWDGEPAPRHVVEEIIRTSEADFARHGYGIWLLEDSDHPERGVIGSVGLKAVPGHEGRVEILYSLDPAYCGRGHATAQAREVLQHGFDLGLSEVLGGTDPPNLASQRVLVRLGMRSIGELSVGGGPPIPYWSIRHPATDPN